MSGKLTHAHRAMLAIATYLVTARVEDKDLALMRGNLARVLPDCGAGPAAIGPVRQAAHELVEALALSDRTRAEVRLEQALRRYSALGAATYIDAWERQAAAEGRQV